MVTRLLSHQMAYGCLSIFVVAIVCNSLMAKVNFGRASHDTMVLKDEWHALKRPEIFETHGEYASIMKDELSCLE